MQGAAHITDVIPHVIETQLFPWELAPLPICGSNATVKQYEVLSLNNVARPEVVVSSRWFNRTAMKTKTKQSKAAMVQRLLIIKYC